MFVCPQGKVCPVGLCPGGGLSRGSLSRGAFSVQGGGILCPGWGGGILCPGGSLSGSPPHGRERTVRILLECILLDDSFDISLVRVDYQDCDSFPLCPRFDWLDPTSWMFSSGFSEMLISLDNVDLMYCAMVSQNSTAEGRGRGQKIKTKCPDDHQMSVVGEVKPPSLSPSSVKTLPSRNYCCGR